MQTQCTAESLCQKYNKLIRTPEATGNSIVPWPVVQARGIAFLIEWSMDAEDGTLEDNFMYHGNQDDNNGDDGDVSSPRW